MQFRNLIRMADDVVIRAEGLGKKYLIGHTAEIGWHVTFRETLISGARDLWRKAANMAQGRAIFAGNMIEEFWALRDVSFEVKRGEVLGIIGRNGAGKSTLLKILSRITEPTEGRVTLKGRVASLLEVGTGFHPELTGRENIYLNGAILGMTSAEIRRKFDEIVAFAEVEKFLDTPVKRYSSGMYVRLAFAVAAHLEPEILVVDEVLAVGDVEFQKKCLGKMSHVASTGRTVLFVSHQLPALATLCSRAMLIEGGRLRTTGPLKSVVDQYLSPAFKEDEFAVESLKDGGSVRGNEYVRVHRVNIVADGKNATYIDMGSPFEIVIDYSDRTLQTKLIIVLYVYSVDGNAVFESLNVAEPACKPHSGSFEGKFIRSRCIIPADLLNEGEYFIKINFVTERLDELFEIQNAARFSIRDLGRRDIATYGRYAGYVHPKLTWLTEMINNLPAQEGVCGD